MAAPRSPSRSSYETSTRSILNQLENLHIGASDQSPVDKLAKLAPDSEDLILGEKIGEGSFAIVYKGKLGKLEVAVKEFRLGSTASEAEYFEETWDKEISIMAYLTEADTKNRVVKYLGYSSETSYQIVMTYMPNGNLTDFMKTHQKPTDYKITTYIMGKIAEGLAFIHEVGFIHGDINCHNILLDQNYQPKIADFGTAKVPDDVIGLMGSFIYMAPEIFTQRLPASFAADIFSWAMVCSALMNWHEPYSDEKVDSFDEIKNFMLQLKKGRRPNLPTDCPSLSSLITWGWKAEPDKRPAAQDLVQLLPITNNEINIAEKVSLLRKI